MTAEQSIRNIERTMDAVNKAARGELKVRPDPRADLVDLFEARAETHDDKSWIEVEEAVDLVMDREAETIAALTAQLQAAQALNPPVEVGSPDGSQVYEIPLTEYLEAMNASQIFRATEAEAKVESLTTQLQAAQREITKTDAAFAALKQQHSASDVALIDAKATIAEMTEATDASHGSKSERLLNIAMIGSRGRLGATS